MPNTSPKPSFTRGAPAPGGSRSAASPTRARSFVQTAGSSEPSNAESTCTSITDTPGRLTDAIRSTSPIFWMADSSGSETSSATCCADAPG